MRCKTLVKNAYLKDAQQGKMKRGVYITQSSWKITRKKTHETFLFWTTGLVIGKS